MLNIVALFLFLPQIAIGSWRDLVKAYHDQINLCKQLILPEESFACEKLEASYDFLEKEFNTQCNPWPTHPAKWVKKKIAARKFDEKVFIDRLFTSYLNYSQLEELKELDDERLYSLTSYIESNKSKWRKACRKKEGLREISLKEQVGIDFQITLTAKCEHIYLNLNRHLGSGASKDVFEVVDYETGGRKAQAKLNTNEQEVVRAFVQESAILANLMRLQEKSPVQGIIKAHYVDPHLLITDKYDGDLSKFMDSLNDDQKIQVLFQISQGLKFLHQNQIIHRDIKPENVLMKFSEDKRIQADISDFGHSFEVTTEGDEIGGGPLRGDLYYLAPEQFMYWNSQKRGISDGTQWMGSSRDEKIENAKKMDVFSFGVLSLELLGISNPTKKCAGLINTTLPDNLESCLKTQILNAKSKLEKYDQLGQLMTRALEMDPSERLNSSELASKLKKLTRTKN